MSLVRRQCRRRIIPRALTAAISDRDLLAAKRAMEAMMTMKKIDIAAIKAARKRA